MTERSGKGDRGAVLKQARQAKGLTIMEVHEATKIPVDVLKAIEEGYTVHTLSDFYLRGFIKMYAQHLGVDPNLVLDAPVKEPAPLVQPAVDPGERLSFDDVTSWLTPERRRLLGKAGMIAVALFVSVRIGGCFLRSRRAVETPHKQAAASRSLRKSKPQTPSRTASRSAGSSGTASVSKPSSKTSSKGSGVSRSSAKVSSSASVRPRGVTLSVKARKRGWLQVKVDGAVVFQSVLEKGAVENWEAEESIELLGKSIHNLEYEVNGRLIGPLGRADRNARRVLVTRDGLTVKE